MKKIIWLLLPILSISSYATTVHVQTLVSPASSQVGHETLLVSFYQYSIVNDSNMDESYQLIEELLIDGELKRLTETINVRAGAIKSTMNVLDTIFVPTQMGVYPIRSKIRIIGNQSAFDFEQSSLTVG